MEIEVVKEKYQTELKWASYCFISSFASSFIYTYFEVLIFNQTQQTFFILLFLNIFIFLYCSFKCVLEIKCEKVVSFFSKLVITLNIFLINYLFISIIATSENIITKREIEIEMTTEKIFETYNNFLKDFIEFMKVKIKR